MTSTPPRALGASAHAACSSPWGPAHVIGVVDNAPCDPGGGPLAGAGETDVTAPVDVAGASAVSFFWLHAAISALAAAAPTPSSPSLRSASRRVSNPST